MADPIAPQNGRAQYPTTDWMEHSELKKPGALSQREWEEWKSLPMKHGSVYAGKRHKGLDKFIEDNPDGFTVHKEHPELRDIQDQVDFFTIPEKEHDDKYFVRPKARPPLTS